MINESEGPLADAASIINDASENTEGEATMPEADRPKHPFGAGVFSWDHLADETDIECLVSNNITEIYQYIKPEYSDDEIMDFLGRMSDRGIDVYILDGEPSWAYKDNFRYMETIVDRIAYINNYVSRRERICGIVYDIEPYVLDKWHSTPDIIMDEYISNVSEVRDKIDRRGYNIEMCVCVPYSFDLMGYEAHLESLIRNSDQVFVLNYNKNNEVENIRTEVELARDYEKRIVTVYEIQPGLLSQTNNSVTYYKDGLGAIVKSYDNIISSYEDKKIGIAYHTLNYLKILSQ
ncbi:hypothetical protein D6855_03025 [Butyrivibrio sp. CB08]|uniref:hypothetical protein n=1 Tax=Butyrivibrio sp. CB08 TaxID=2364879 RepID=UPI000EA8BBD1|nr:hypothetical protein [Butyrivibrio sp. CB08]RKM62403.1 hypothetical protein D6855_03025 [Butyrivibrio sp. CB08]